RATVDEPHVSNGMAYRSQKGGCQRTNVPRSERHGSDASRKGRMQRARDRYHHRPLAERYLRDHGLPLPAPRSRARDERNSQARNGEQNCIKSSQLTPNWANDTMSKQREKLCKSIHWWTRLIPY